MSDPNPCTGLLIDCLCACARSAKFIEADYSQLELRCAAFCAQDPVMLEAYKHDADLHDKTWNNLSGGAPYSEDHDIAKRQRTIAKTCNFGYFMVLVLTLL